MTANGYLQIALYLGVLIGLSVPLGWYMAKVYEGTPPGIAKVLRPFERLLYWLCGVKEDEEMNWQRYALAMLLFNLAGTLVVYALQRLQGYFPLVVNPESMAAVEETSAFNTATSFATNTNWQGYGGETTMSYLTQMAALGVQNFVSAATGMACLIPLIRGFARKTTDHLGNFWVDLFRSTIYILLPLSIVFALVLVSQGVIQNFTPYQTAALVQATSYDDPVLDSEKKPVMEQVKDEKGVVVMEPVKDDKGNPVLDDKKQPQMQPKMQPKVKNVAVKEMKLPMGPAASQIAIKQLGTNGGGFFNVNSAHPYENPTPLANFLSMLAILQISGAMCLMFGHMVKDKRQGWAILAAMTIVLVGFMALCVGSEQSGNPAFADLGVNQTASGLQAGGNMEGKETRFGVVNSAIWATVTTGASNGSVNSMHDSFTPLGGLVPMLMMQLGEVIYGGVGCGLYGMIVFAIGAVFVAGLMVGRTPEYLGKKIETYEMKMVAMAILIPPMLTLIGTALAVIYEPGLKSTSNPGAHGFSQLLYAYSSMSNNNGSAFAGLSANIPFHNMLGGFCMLVSRFALVVPVLAMAGSLAQKKSVPVGAGTLPTHTPLFVGLLVSKVLIVGALTFIPALALGPIVEHLQMTAPKVAESK